MGRSRGGKRRTVLQLGEQKESYLKRYGYNRQEEGEEGNQYGGESESDDEDAYPNIPEEEMEEIPLPPPSTSKPAGPKANIDDKVANFLAEIDALEPEEESAQPEDDLDIKPSFAPIDPKPSFQLNVDQTPSYMEPNVSVKQEPKVTIKLETKTPSSYKSMFVQGASEFTRPKEENLNNASKEKEEIWPDEPISDWQQILDDNTQCYYYWNIQTNDVRWEIPSEYTQYLLLRKEYEEKIDRLTKDGKVKPTTARQIKIASDGHHVIKTEPTDKVTDSFGPELPPSDKKKADTLSKDRMDESSYVSSTSNVTEQSDPALNKSATSSISRNKPEVLTYGPQLPDSTASKSKKPKLVDAIYDDESDECSSSNSEIDSEDERELMKAKAKKEKKKGGNGEDSDLDIDDIDKALELALEKKKDEKKASSSKKSEDKGIKKKSLVEEMREQVQKKQEVEARRKAAIEEMMARELERRVGPPRQSIVPEEPAFKPKILDYEHGRKQSKPMDYDLDARDSKSKDPDRDSKRKRDDRKSDKDRDRKRRKDEKDSHKRDKDEKEDRRKEKDDKKKDRHRDKDEKRSDSKRKEEKSSKEEEKHGKRKDEKDDKKDKKKSHGHSDSESVESKKLKVESEIVVPEENEVTKKKSESKDVFLANLRQQASELAELALSKLEFLEVTKKGLSKLQILLMELETRQYDWQSGGLDTEYFIKKLDEANTQLEHYEQNAAPPGWSCHWDRAYRRYFYMSKRSGRTQWDYPDEEEEEEENYDNEQESEREEMETESPEQPQTPVYPCEDKNSIPEIKVPEPEQVTSTTAFSSQSHVSVSADTTTSMHTSLLKPAVSESVSRAENQTLDEEESSEKKIEMPIPVPVHDPKDIESALNFIIGSEPTLASGEPPPPGTGLDMLFVAPPPPPPPVEEYPVEQYSSFTKEEENVTGLETNGDKPYKSIVPNDNHVDEVPEKLMPVGTVALETNGIHEAEMTNVEYEKNQHLADTESVENREAVITKPPVVSIARPPQILVNTGQIEGANMSVTLVEGPSSNITGQSVPYVTSSSSDVTGLAVQSKPTPSSSVTDSTTSDTAHHGDKKKKKKDKDKDKSISSASLTLKKKNVSSLVQKWQKVKKEVEIEERHQEEREMAIRQKLEEWKKDHN